MDKTIKYRNIIQKVRSDFVALRESMNTPIQTQVLIDTTNDHYQVLRTGWRNGKQVFNVIFHFDIINEKIYLQRNVSDYDIIEDIELLGVPKHDIVLAFHAPNMRPFTGYAAA
jgi:hypothetical protein